MRRATSLINVISIGAFALSTFGANALRVDAATDGQARMSAPAQPDVVSPPLPEVTGMPRIDTVRPADAAAKPNASAFAAEIPREVSSATFVARAAPEKNVTFEVMLPLQHQDDLMALIKGQQDRQSPLYHKWLKKGDFAQRFHSNRAAVETVNAALKANGLHVINISATGTAIKASGSVSSVEKLFSTRIGEFTKQNRTYFANTTPAAHPAVFHGLDLGVLGLSNLPLAKPQYVDARFTKQTRKATKKPAKNGAFYASGAAGGYLPGDLAAAYNFPWQYYGSAADGHGSRLAVIMSNDFLDSDIANFYNDLSARPTGGYVRVPVNGGGTFSSPGSIEVTLDVQQSTALAPGAFEYVYEIPTLSAVNLYDAEASVVADDAADVITMSFGGPEYHPYDQYFNVAFAQGVSQGQAWFASSGDSGAYCDKVHVGVCSPASDPFVVAVGGTSLYTDQLDERAVEFAWGYSGGGASIQWVQPGYQTVYERLNQYAYSRNVPDIASDADPKTGVELVFNGAEGTVGGTSVSSPDMAAAWTDIVGHYGRLGQPDSYLYYFAYNGLGFHDILLGCNGYCSQPGFDLVTGFGSIDANLLYEFI